MIRGEVRAVPAAAQASVLVLPVSIDSGDEWVVLRADQLEIEPVKSVDPLRPIAHVRANAVEVGEDAVLSNLSTTTAHALMSTLLSAEAVGVARWATDTASEYAKIREQFGRPIGQFQAIKHKCAEMIADTERATAAVWDAARAIDEAASRKTTGTQPVQHRIRRGGGGDVSSGRRPALHPGLHPGARRHRLHLGARHERLLPPGADAGRRVRPRLGVPAAGRRHRDQPPACARSTSTWTPTPRSCAPRSAPKSAALKAIPRDERTVAIVEGGWVLPYLPKPWGRSATPVEQIIIAQEFSAGRVRRPQVGIAAWIFPSIVAFGTEEQKQRFLPPTFRGEMIWCQLFSEPGAGSDLAGLSTKATKVDGGWRITGQKIWTTAAQFSQWGALLARTEPSAPKHNGITYFLLDMKSEGVEVKPLRELTGDEMFNTVFIDDVFVPDECVLGEVNRGWEVSRNTLTAERVSIGSSDANFLANPARVRRVRSRRAVRPGRPEPGRAVDRRGPCRQGAEPALDAVDAGRRRRHAVGGDLQAVVDAHRPGLCRIRGVLVRHRRRDRRPRSN